MLKLVLVAPLWEPKSFIQKGNRLRSWSRRCVRLPVLTERHFTFSFHQGKKVLYLKKTGLTDCGLFLRPFYQKVKKWSGVDDN